jgi:hypothetical protein
MKTPSPVYLERVPPKLKRALKSSPAPTKEIKGLSPFFETWAVF